MLHILCYNISMANENPSPTIESTIYDFPESQRNPATAAAYETGLSHFKNYIEQELEMSLQASPAPFDHALISGVIKYIRKLKDKGSDLAPAGSDPNRKSKSQHRAERMVILV